MKLLFLVLFAPFAIGILPHPVSQPSAPVKDETVTLLCRVYARPTTMDSLYLFESYGLGYKTVARAGRRASDSLFVFTVPKSPARIYLLGTNESPAARLILGEEKEVMLYANAQFLSKARTTGSPANKALEVLQKRFDELRATGEEERLAYNKAGAPDKQAGKEKLRQLTLKKQHLLDSLKTTNPLLWRIGTLSISPDFYGQHGYANEIEFFGSQFFAYAHMAEERAYDQMPDVTFAFDNYFHTLMQIGASQEQMKKFPEDELAKIPASSTTYRMALSGLINAAKAANSYLYPVWAKLYMDTYKNSSYGEIKRMEFDLRRASTFLIGLEAPELAGMTPDSQRYALSNLRGKVVLVDFWASWCGPCRLENPNVKKNYEKYHDKGFDVLGVSLDREAGAWKGAIKQDGLVWHHISDLKGWQSAYAQLYSITSIPQTVLIDKEGRILGRNIRGEQLGEKLRQIFGD